jgi:hypothetical protein
MILFFNKTIFKRKQFFLGPVLTFLLNFWPAGNIAYRAGHVERYQLQSYRFKPFFVTLESYRSSFVKT